MQKLIDALTVIKEECTKHETCDRCPMCIPDDVWGGNYCSVIREGTLPSEWIIENMIR